MVEAENHEVLKHYSLLYAAFAGNRRSYVDFHKMFRADIHFIICFIIAPFFLLVQCFVCLLLFLFRNNDMVAGLQLTQAVYHLASMYRYADEGRFSTKQEQHTVDVNPSLTSALAHAYC